MADKENNLPIETTMSDSDFFRAVIGGISSRISTTNAAAVLSTLITTLDNFKKIRTETTSTNLLDTDEVLRMDCTGGTRAVLLVDATTVFSNGTGQTFWIKRADNTAANDLQINTTGGQTIDGDANWTLTGSTTERLWIQIISNGSNWDIIG